MKALLDTNALVSVLLRPDGVSRQIFDRWLDGEFELAVYLERCLNSPTLPRPHIVKKYHLTEQLISQHLDTLRTEAEVAPGLLILDAVPDDPKDNHILAAALRLLASTSSPATVTCWTFTNFRASKSSRHANS